MDFGNCAILDRGCNSPVCGKKFLDCYIDSLDQSDNKLEDEECSCLE